jgi:serine/threonine-protein kinase
MFSAGQMLAGRYRIVSRLGGGGMGEVYRADDLTLGASVALKFLPADAIARPGWLDRFRSEVRLTRQISHPAVCRVYDIAEVEGRVFLSMEFIDGEDLASLVRRIGRLPQDKAVEIARQVCFGLAAAHELGVVHRDLKPANIMLDGRGNARVMDFGVAGIAAELNASGRVSAGTPAYMAPEQLEGREISRKSDLYSLGLVLYELFTGKPAFNTQTMEELRHSRLSGTRPTDPSSVVAGLDPAVERVILHCLEVDPALRPSSAVAVAAALPGGDPLAAAIAAGETPSPELVAASGEAGTLKPYKVAALVAAAVVMLVAVFIVRDRLSLLHRSPMELSPEVLAAKAREHLRTLGYVGKPNSEIYGFQVRSSLLANIEKQDTSQQRWDKVSERGYVPFAFWYRSSPASLQALVWWQMNPTMEDPPPRRVGDVLAMLDIEGNLRYLSYMSPSAEDLPVKAVSEHTDRASQVDTPSLEPAQADASREPTVVPSASQQLDAAGVMSQLRSVMALDGDVAERSSTSLHGVPSDQRFAFTGTIPSAAPIPITIEAAAARGRIVGIETMYPWTPGSAGIQQQPPNLVLRFVEFSGTALQLGLFISAAVLARRNLRTNRADRRGAARVAAISAILGLSSSLLLSTWTNNVAETFFGAPLVRAVFHAGLWWVAYIAIEPVIRRVWPHAIISWSRFLEGRWRDPLVGRDLLIGIVAGLAIVLTAEPLAVLIASLTNAPPPVPFLPNTIALIGPRFAIGQTVDAVGDSIVITLLVSLGMIVARGLLRHPLLVVATIFACMYVVGFSGPFQDAPYRFFLAIPWAAVPTYIFTQRGILSGAAMLSVTFMILRLPMTLDTSRWYAGAGIILALLLVCVTLYAAKITLGRQSIFSRSLLDH